MADTARLIGINHVAIEVGSVEEALDLYGRLFSFTLRGRGRRMAFVDMGDQFLALAEPRHQSADDERHFGLVVDDVSAARDAVRREGEQAGGGTGGSLPFTGMNLLLIVAAGGAIAASGVGLRAVAQRAPRD